MNSVMRIWKENRQLVSFFALTYLISWVLWILSEVLDSPFLLVLGRYGPLAATLIVVPIHHGWSGLKGLFKRFRVWKVALIWYGFCFLATALIAMTAIRVNQCLTGITPIYNDPGQWYLVFPVFTYVMLFSVLGEETGWRGFALPKLQSKCSALTSGVIIGGVWGVWHLPLFFMEGDFHGSIPFGLFIVQDIALSILMTWLYNNTKGSLLIAHLFHTASNVTIGLLPVLPLDTNGDMGTLYLTVAILIVFTSAVVAINGPANLSRKHKKIQEFGDF